MKILSQFWKSRQKKEGQEKQKESQFGKFDCSFLEVTFRIQENGDILLILGNTKNQQFPDTEQFAKEVGCFLATICAGKFHDDFIFAVEKYFEHTNQPDLGEEVIEQFVESYKTMKESSHSGKSFPDTSFASPHEPLVRPTKVFSYNHDFPEGK